MKYISTSLKILLSAALLNGAVACKKDNDPETPVDPGYTVPATYSFENADGESTVSFSGQKQRLEMLSEMTTYMKSANTVGVTLDAQTLKNMYANQNYTWIDAPELGMTGSSKQLKSKTAAGDVGIQMIFEGYMDDIAGISEVSEGNDAQEYGIAGVWTNGSNNYLQSEQGIEYTQLIEKGLMCAVFMNQMTDNYLSSVESDDNSAVLEGKTYTEMQHHWDEAYGYFTSEVDYPLNGTDRFWGKYANSREDLLGSSSKISEAFRKGRAAIDNKDYEVRDAQIEIIRIEMEKLCAGTAIHYLNDAITYITDPTKKNHVLSEAVAFIDGLRFGHRTISGEGISTENIDTALALIGMDFEVVTIANINATIDLIAANTGLSNIKNDL